MVQSDVQRVAVTRKHGGWAQVNYLVQVLALAAVYYGVGRLGLAAGALKGNVTPVWPPTGVAIAALMLLGYRLWPGVAAGALLVNGISAVPFLTAVGMSAGNTLEALAGAYLLVRVARAHVELDRVSDVLALSALTAGVATMISATIGVASLRLGGVIPMAAVAQTWRVWWMGDALGALVVTPVVLALWPGRRPSLDRRRAVEAAALLAALTGITVLTFSGAFDYVYVVFPLLIWAALRWRLQGAALATLVISTFAVLGTRAGHGAFAGGGATRSLWLLDTFLAVVALTGLVLSAVVSERDHASEHSAELDRRTKALAESDTRYRALVDHLPGSGVLLLDRDLNVIANGGALFAAQGYPPETILGRPVADVLPESDAAYLMPFYRAALAGEPSGTFEFTPVSGRHYLVDAIPLDYDTGIVEHVLVAVRDITELAVAMRARERAESGYQAAFEDAPVGMAKVSLSGRLERVNPALCALLGYSRADLEGRNLLSLVHPQDVAAADEAIGRLRAGQTSTYQARRRYLHARGHHVWVEVSSVAVTGEDGQVDHLLMHYLDITERKQFEQDLEHLANHDPLTGLLNRRGFEAELDRHAALVARYGPTGALLLLDLDHFKQINDTLGHNAGDQLIASLAEVLRRTVRDTDVVARLGGDEFAIVLPQDGQEEAELVADKILRAVRHEVTLLGGKYPRAVTVSIGVALFDRLQVSREDVLISADLSLYEAKDSGRDRFVFYSSVANHQSRIKARLDWVERINAALRNNQFVLYAQPILDLARETTNHYELLLRMLDDDGNLIEPNAFMHIAERSGLMGRIDRWVTGQAIQMLTDPSLPADMVLEVNLSALTVGDPEMLEFLEEQILNMGADPSRLVFEITETAAIANIHRARTFVERLSEIGCQFAIDDFGAGFGSFYYLKHLQFDYIKIDGEFVSNCVDSAADQLVISSLVMIARGLNKRTIAEFVGDEPTLELLRALGVDYAQGFFIGKPVPLQALRRQFPALGTAIAPQGREKGSPHIGFA